MRSSTGRAALIVFTVCLCVPASARTENARRDRLIQRVSASLTAANFSSGEVLILTVTTARDARLGVQVVDRDGFVVRTFPSKNGVAGANSLTWDGRDDRGALVPDEAYSFRIAADGGADEYFPASRTARMAVVEPQSYSRTTATLTYALATPSRVHIQAGTVRAGTGPVLKTIVDRQPRGTGRVAEHWTGFDESGSLYVPDLPGFAIAIAATPLPENSVIAFGNSKQTFLDYAAHRTGHSLFSRRARGAHHAGLDVFNDVAPHLAVAPAWSGTKPTVHLQLHASGPTASAFLRQPGKIFLFVDSNLVATRPARNGAGTFDVPLPATGEHFIAVNWRSDYGPVAVAVVKVRRGPEPPAAQTGSRP